MIKFSIVSTVCYDSIVAAALHGTISSHYRRWEWESRKVALGWCSIVSHIAGLQRLTLVQFLPVTAWHVISLQLHFIRHHCTYLACNDRISTPDMRVQYLLVVTQELFSYFRPCLMLVIHFGSWILLAKNIIGSITKYENTLQVIRMRWTGW